ncbi:MAG: hypothetical protein P1U56_24395, partial [Saprospiraceae bacterium]|nr:hypothetical protein [Saprospiraceae bacterium]
YRQNVLENDSLKTTPLVANHYDETETEGKLFGKGAFQLKEGKQKIVDFRKDFATPDTLKFYVWVEITNKKYGMPEFTITVKGENDHYYSKYLPSREHKDIYKNWIRAEHIFPIPKGKNWIEVIAKGNQNFWIDELTISRNNEVTLKDYEKEGIFLYNGYPVPLN